MIKSFLFLLIIFILGCSGKSDSILSTPVQKKPGSLQVLNKSGFLGATVAGTSIDYVLKIKANGGLSLHDLMVSIETNDPVSFKGGVYPGEGGTCSDSLKSGETCTIVLFYEPVDTASHAALIHFSYRDSLKSYQNTYQVSADSHPILNFEYGTLYDFGNKFIGSSTDLRIRISNTGKVVAENLSVGNLALPFSLKGGSYPGTGGTCGTSLSPGQTCDIYVNYSPTTNGEHLQNITLNYFNTGRPETNTLRMMAWGFREAVLTVSDGPTYNYGTVATGAPTDKVFTITHESGDIQASSISITGLSSPFSFKGGNFPGTGGTCSDILTKEKHSCTVVITINSNDRGSWSNNPVFNYFNGKENKSISRMITATTRERAMISLTPASVLNLGITDMSTSITNVYTVNYLSGEIPVTNMEIKTLSGYFSYTGGTYPGTGGTCGASLSSGSCTISLTYSPSIYGVHTSSPQFHYNDGSGNKTIALTLQGRTTGRFTTSGGSFGNVVNGQVKETTITLTSSAGNNITNLQATSIPAPYNFKGGSFPGTGGTCTSTLNASSNCTIIVSFSPLTEGNHNQTLVLSYDGGTGTRTQNIGLSGTSTPAANITIPPTDFGTVSINGVQELLVTITNSSTISPVNPIWTLPEGFSFKGGTSPGTDGNCWFYSSTTCKIALVFSPTENKTYQGNIILKYQDGAGNNKTATALLSGNGTPTNELFISEFDTYNFSNVHIGNNKDVVFKLSHGGGTTPAIISNKLTSNTTDYSIVSDLCPAALSNGAHCFFSVRFAPQSNGVKNSSFTVNYNNGTSKSVTRLITGNGLNPAVLTPSLTSVNFGDQAVGQNYQQEIVFTYSGQTNATSFITTIAGTGFTIVSNNCSSTVSSSTCRLYIRFSPTIIQAYSGSLNYSYYNGFKTVTGTISVTGNGAPTALLSFSPTSYNFGKIIQTLSSEKTITIKNTGTAQGKNLQYSNLTGSYRYKGGAFPGTGGTCDTTLDTGNSCTLVVEFNPTTIGIQNFIFQLNYHNGLETRTTSTSFTGEGIAQAILSISESNPYHFGSTNSAGGIDKEFTISNSGSVPATNISGTFDISEFHFKGGPFPGTGGNCSTTLAVGANCKIVIRFKPNEVRSYASMFTLNYFDGLRDQVELKNFTGTGTASFNPHYYSMINSHPVQEKWEIELERESITAEMSQENIKLMKEDKIFYQEENHLAPLYEGLHIEKIDGTDNLLFSIQNEEQEVTGYTIRSGKTGQILERFIINREYDLR